MPLAILCALASAVALAFGAERQGGAVRAEHEEKGLALRGLLGLFGNRRWLWGMLLMGAGTVLNIIALANAPISLIQPIGSLALVVTAFAHARTAGIRLPARVFAATAACLLGSASFVLLGLRARAGDQPITLSQERTILILTGLLIVVFGAVALTKLRLPPVGYVLAAGLLFGMVAVQVKTVAQAVLSLGSPLAQGWVDALARQMPWVLLLGLVLASVLGGWFVQQAYSSGPPDIVIAGLTVVDPLVGVLVGIFVLHELRPDAPALLLCGMALAGAVAIVGVLALARFHPDARRRVSGVSASGARLPSSTPSSGVPARVP